MLEVTSKVLDEGNIKMLYCRQMIQCIGFNYRTMWGLWQEDRKIVELYHPLVSCGLGRVIASISGTEWFGDCRGESVY